MMKKYSIYIGLVVIGLLAGWLFFGQHKETEIHHHENEIIENQMWTCSMHPQIMQNEPGSCPICGMDLTPMVVSPVALKPDQFKMTTNAMALANIQTTIVGKELSLNNSIFTLSGIISENKDKTATQPAHFNGRLEKLFVTSLGQTVKMGQPVAEVYSPELITAQQELIIAAKTKVSQPALYQAVRNKFKNWYIKDIQLDEIENSGIVKTNLTVYAHVSGVVTEISVNVGAHIMNGKPIFKVANLNTVWANFDVYENQLSLFKVGQQIDLTTKAYKNKIKSRVRFIDPVLNEQTRTVSLRAVLLNTKQLLKPGMFVTGEIQTRSTNNHKIHIPASAVLWTGKRSLVYVKVKNEQPVFEMREITIGRQNGSLYPVLSGLKNGEEIVTNGTFTVDAAAQLQGKKSMMN